MRTLAQISDLHFGRHDPDAANALLESIAETRPDLVVVSGDLTQRARSAEFEQARRFLERIVPPKLIVPGNHDIPLFDVLDRLLTPSRKFDRYIKPLDLPNSEYIDPELVVLGLDTVRRLTGKNGRVSHEQMERLRAMFRQAPEGAFKVLVTHHPLATPQDAAPAERAWRSRLALQAGAAAGVHLLLSGHHHAALSGPFLLAEAACRNRVLVVHAGTAISTRTRGQEGNSFNILRVEGNRISVTVMALSRAGRFERSRAASYCLDQGCWRTAAPSERTRT